MTPTSWRRSSPTCPTSRPTYTAAPTRRVRSARVRALRLQRARSGRRPLPARGPSPTPVLAGGDCAAAHAPRQRLVVRRTIDVRAVRGRGVAPGPRRDRRRRVGVVRRAEGGRLMRILFSRHAESTLNVAGRMNGDPSVPVELTRVGEPRPRARHPARARADSTSASTRASRAPGRRRDRARQGRDVRYRGGAAPRRHRRRRPRGQRDRRLPRVEDAHTRSDAFPGGESLDDAAHRYADAFERLAAGPGTHVLVVCHEIPIRYASTPPPARTRSTAPCTTLAMPPPSSSPRGAREGCRADSRPRPLETSSPDGVMLGLPIPRPERENHATTSASACRGPQRAHPGSRRLRGRRGRR